MIPKNRDELIGMLTRGFAASGVAFWTDATTIELLGALDAAGLAIAPKEPTEAMLEAGEGCAAIAYAYDLMLEASPFKEDTDHE